MTLDSVLLKRHTLYCDELRCKAQLNILQIHELVILACIIIVGLICAKICFIIFFIKVRKTRTVLGLSVNVTLSLCNILVD